MKKPILLFSVLLIGLSTTLFAAEDKTDADIVEELRETAGTVYALMDRNEFKTVYEMFASAQFRDGVLLTDWVTVAGGARDELGTNTSRDLIEIRKERVLFGEPKEEFYAMLYEADYTSAKVYDRLVFVREDGGFKIVGIWSVGRD